MRQPDRRDSGVASGSMHDNVRSFEVFDLATAALEPAETTIYFAREGTAVKIGITDGDPDARVCSLQVGNPREIELVGYFQGPKTLEAELHAHFCRDRIRGEWFRWTTDLQDAIDRLGLLQAENDARAVARDTRRELALVEANAEVFAEFELSKYQRECRDAGLEIYWNGDQAHLDWAGGVSRAARFSAARSQRA